MQICIAQYCLKAVICRTSIGTIFLCIQQKLGLGFVWPWFHKPSSDCPDPDLHLWAREASVVMGCALPLRGSSFRSEPHMLVIMHSSTLPPIPLLPFSISSQHTSQVREGHAEKCGLFPLSLGGRTLERVHDGTQVSLPSLPSPAHPHTLLGGHLLRTLLDGYVTTPFHLTFRPKSHRE